MFFSANGGQRLQECKTSISSNLENDEISMIIHWKWLGELYLRATLLSSTTINLHKETDYEKKENSLVSCFPDSVHGVPVAPVGDGAGE